MQYQVLHACHFLSISRALERLTAKVNEAIARGWEPLGGVTVSDKGTVAQAMVKRR